MTRKIAKVGIKKEKGYLYFLDDNGDVSRVKMSSEGREGKNPEVVATLGLKKTQEYLYFIDEDGDVSQTKIGPTT